MKAMNEQRIRQLWQQGQMDGTGLEQAAGLFADTAAEHGAALDALTRDPLAARLAQSALALGADAEQLSTALRRLRQPQPAFTRRRVVGWAMAASVLAFAVLVSPRQSPVPAPAADGAALSPGGLIVSASFESTAGDTPATAPAPNRGAVFSAGFDS